MNSISWQVMPTAENATIKKEGSFLQKLSVPCSSISRISIKLVYPAMVNLANNLTAHVPLQLFRNLRV